MNQVLSSEPLPGAMTLNEAKVSPKLISVHKPSRALHDAQVFLLLRQELGFLSVRSSGMGATVLI